MGNDFSAYPGMRVMSKTNHSASHPSKKRWKAFFFNNAATLPNGILKNRQEDPVNGNRNGGVSAGKSHTDFLFRRKTAPMQLALFRIQEKKDGYLYASSNRADPAVRIFTQGRGMQLGGFADCTRVKIVGM